MAFLGIRVCSLWYWQTFSGYQLHRHDALSQWKLFPCSWFQRILSHVCWIHYVRIFCEPLCQFSNRNGKETVEIHSRRSGEYVSSASTFARSIWLSFAVVIPIFGFLKGKRIGSIVTIVFLTLVLSVSSLSCNKGSGVFDYRSFRKSDSSESLENISPYVERFSMDRYRRGQLRLLLWTVQSRRVLWCNGTSAQRLSYDSRFVRIPGLIAFLCMWFVIIQAGFKTYNILQLLCERTCTREYLGDYWFYDRGTFQNYYGTFANCWDGVMAGFTMASFRLYTKEGKIKL